MATSQRSASETPWRTLSAEDLEKQYSPSRWVIRMKVEEVVSTFVQTGIQANSMAIDLTKMEAAMRMEAILAGDLTEMERTT